MKFQPGSIVATIGATHLASQMEIAAMLDRHLSGDWGDLAEDDKQANEDALKWGDRILSSYQIQGEKLWVITEADRSSTCVLTPGEY
jgi:hypothetical protein